MPLRIEQQDRVRLITIDRPQARNVIDEEIAESLYDAFKAFERDCGAGVAVLAGADGVFCAGADTKWLASWTPETLDRYAFDQRADRSPLGLLRLQLSKPTIAAISGFAVGGGIELALFCDLRVMDDDGFLWFANRRLDVSLIDGGAVRLARLVGTARAMDALLTGRRIAAAEAKAIGLVDRCVRSGTATARAVELATEIAQWPQLSLRADRATIAEQMGSTLQQALRAEYERGAAAFRFKLTSLE